MMTLRQSQKHLDVLLVRLLTNLGFRRTECLEYSRSMNDATALLSWPCRLDARGFPAFNCIAGVEFELLSGLLDLNAIGAAPGFGLPIHFLRRDKRFVEWKFSEAKDLEDLSGTIQADLEALAIPFLERYSKLAELREVVESPNKSDWINVGLDVDRRVCMLAAIRFIEGDETGAMGVLDDALKERERARGFRKHGVMIELLRKRMEKMSGPR